MTLTRFVGSLAAAMLVAASAAAPARAETAAERAVEAAKKYSGSEISVVWEAGLQSLDPLNFSGPQWEKLTGIKIKVIEVPTAEMFTKILQEHRAGTGAYDALNVVPSWMPDLVRAGALEQLELVCGQVRFPRRAAEDRADLSRQSDEGGRQDLWLPGRR